VFAISVNRGHVSTHSVEHIVPENKLVKNRASKKITAGIAKK
jgi:hypothetical protein